jgi:hypothetical protein
MSGDITFSGLPFIHHRRAQSAAWGLRLVYDFPREYRVIGEDLLGNRLGEAYRSGSLALNRRLVVRPLLASAALAVAIALAGCTVDEPPALSGRHMQPISEQMLADIERKNMSKESAILVRIFKEESELEVWKENRDGQFALLKTYPICRWSGELGPKVKEGDRQAPEGFYTITPGLMNPNSQYYLAINTGFPNAYDRANDRHGGFLMISRRLLLARLLRHD